MTETDVDPVTQLRILISLILPPYKHLTIYSNKYTDPILRTRCTEDTSEKLVVLSDEHNQECEDLKGGENREEFVAVIHTHAPEVTDKDLEEYMCNMRINCVPVTFLKERKHWLDLAAHTATSRYPEYTINHHPQLAAVGPKITANSEELLQPGAVEFGRSMRSSNRFYFIDLPSTPSLLCATKAESMLVPGESVIIITALYVKANDGSETWSPKDINKSTIKVAEEYPASETVAALYDDTKTSITRQFAAIQLAESNSGFRSATPVKNAVDNCIQTIQDRNAVILQHNFAITTGIQTTMWKTLEGAISHDTPEEIEESNQAAEWNNFEQETRPSASDSIMFLLREAKKARSFAWGRRG